MSKRYPMIQGNKDEVSSLTDRGIRPITDREFALFQELIQREAGIHLTPAKKPLLVGRLSRRLRVLGLKSFGDYYRLVMERGSAELTVLLDCICTNETHFFREPRQFEFLEQRLFPEWEDQAASGKRSRRVRVWSAACSTGEEPYSLAMMLWDHFPSTSGWEIEILATDLSTRALKLAEDGVWSIEKAKEIPPKYLKSYMLRGTRSQEGKMKVCPALRSMVRFERANLNRDLLPVMGLFDLIFCRNVLIYFNNESKTRVVERLLNHLAPTGYLFVGHAESLNSLTDRVWSVIPTVYVLAWKKDSEAKNATAVGIPIAS